MKPKFSVVTPSCNQVEFIEDTLKSVMNQDYENVEHWVIDGGSDDGTLDILKEYEDRYNLKWISEEDGGQTHAINKGFKRATGKYVGWLNSDDVYILEDTARKVVKAFEMSSADVVYGDWVKIDKSNKLLDYESVPSDITLEELMRGNRLGQPSVFFTRSLVNKYKLDEDYDYCMDYEYWARLKKNGVDFEYVGHCLSAFRFYAESKSQEEKGGEIDEDTKKLREKYDCRGNGLKESFLTFVDNYPLRIFWKLGGIRSFWNLLGRDSYTVDVKRDRLVSSMFRQIGRPWTRVLREKLARLNI